jgi:hypothetical protein
MSTSSCPTDLTPTAAIYTCYMRPRLNNLSLHLVCRQFRHELLTLPQDFSKTMFLFCSYDAIRSFFAFVAAKRTIHDPLRRHPPLFRRRRHFHRPRSRFLGSLRASYFARKVVEFEDMQDLLQRYNIELIAVGVWVDIASVIPIFESGCASRLIHGRGVVVEG